MKDWRIHASQASTMKKNFRFVVAVLLTFAAVPAGAAQFSLLDDDEYPHLRMAGTIEPGDAENFAKLVLAVAKQKSASAFPRTLQVDSNGGSVREAVRIAALVERLRLNTSVTGTKLGEAQRRGMCASACFIVWLAGFERYALAPTGDTDFDRKVSLLAGTEGNVGLHRPYLDLAESSAPNMTDAQGQQRQAMISLRRYLEDRNVSSALIEKMMAHTSRNIYWLRAQDLDFLYNSPEYEELLASNCGYRRTIINAESSDADFEASMHEQSRPVQEKLNACSRALLKRIRAKELPDLFLRLNQGWRPWS